MACAGHRALPDWADAWRVSPNGRVILAPGTPIAIVGAYDFDAPPPWRRLPLDSAAGPLGPAEITEVESFAGRTAVAYFTTTIARVALSVPSV